MNIAYQIENLTKIYKKTGKKANDGLSLHIHEGEIFGLLGPNGAGKSTLVNQIAGLLRPTSGLVRLFGIDVTKRPDVIPEYVAVQPQAAMTLRDLYPEEALQYTAQLRGVPTSIARRQTQELMDELDLNSLRKRSIHRLSGGQQQLVSLAVTFVGDRPVQIFDEPTNNLDPQVRRKVWDKLLQLNQRGITIIVVTHNVLEAEQVLHRVGIINHGRLLSIGTLGELKAKVDQQIRLDLSFKSDPALFKSLESLGEVQVIAPRHWTILCHHDTVQQAINQIFQVGLQHLDDFRILTPSLEDVYLQLGGGTNLG